MSGGFQLEKETSTFILAPLEQRVKWVQRDHWVNTPVTRATHQWMEYLLRSERRDRPDCMQIVAAPDMGKSAILNAFARMHPVEMTADCSRARRPFLLVNASVGDAGVKGLRNAIFKAAWPDAKQLEGTCSEARCDQTLVAQGVRFLFLDETGEITKTGPSMHRKILSEIKRISNCLHVNIGCASVFGFDHALKADKQLESRFKKKIIIPAWTETQDFRNFLYGLEMYLPFRARSELDRQQLVKWFLLHCHGNTGEITGMIRMAAMHALDREGSFVSMDDFEAARTSELPPRCALQISAAA